MKIKIIKLFFSLFFILLPFSAMSLGISSPTFEYKDLKPKEGVQQSFFLIREKTGLEEEVNILIKGNGQKHVKFPEKVSFSKYSLMEEVKFILEPSEYAHGKYQVKIDFFIKNNNSENQENDMNISTGTNMLLDFNVINEGKIDYNIENLDLLLNEQNNLEIKFDLVNTGSLEWQPKNIEAVLINQDKTIKETIFSSNDNFNFLDPGQENSFNYFFPKEIETGNYNIIFYINKDSKNYKEIKFDNLFLENKIIESEIELESKQNKNKKIDLLPDKHINNQYIKIIIIFLFFLAGLIILVFFYKKRKNDKKRKNK